MNIKKVIFNFGYNPKHDNECLFVYWFDYWEYLRIHYWKYFSPDSHYQGGECLYPCTLSTQQGVLLTWLGPSPHPAMPQVTRQGTDMFKQSYCFLLKDIKVLFLQVQNATQTTILSPVKGRSHTFWDFLGKTDGNSDSPLRVNYG